MVPYAHCIRVRVFFFIADRAVILGKSHTQGYVSHVGPSPSGHIVVQEIDMVLIEYESSEVYCLEKHTPLLADAGIRRAGVRYLVDFARVGQCLHNQCSHIRREFVPRHNDGTDVDEPKINNSKTKKLCDQ
jgi:hypothetical protein